MTYRSFISNSNVFFMIGDDTILDFNSHENVEKLVKSSNDALETLILEVKEKLVQYATEELSLMEQGVQGDLTNTLAYAKIMHMLNQYIYVENEKKRFETEGNVPEERWLSEGI